MPQVFISYSHKDEDFVRKLAHDLEGAGYDTWWDVSGIQGGEKWLGAIATAVKASQYCVVVLSPSAVESEWVEREYLFALQSELKVIPVLYQNCAVPLALANRQYIDFCRKRYQQALSELLTALGKDQTPPVDPVPIFPLPLDMLLKVVALALVILALVGGGWAISRFQLSPPGTPVVTSVVLTEDGLPETVKLEALPPPTPTHTPTFTLVPTDTPLPPTKTPTPTNTPLPPTNTPTPAPTDMPVPPTDIPTPAPTNTPIPPTFTRPVHTATLAPTASPTAPATQSPSVPVGQFALLKPMPPDVSTSGLTGFEWRWNGPVEAGQGFEVRVWREGEPPAGAHDAVADNLNGRVESVGENTYRLVVDITDASGVQGRSGEYLWTVLLVQVSPEYRDLGIQAEPGRLRLDIPGAPDDGKKPTP